MSLSDELAINAWTGDERENRGSPAASVRNWGAVSRSAERPYRLAAGPAADLNNWQDPDVGWGVVLPDVAGMTDADLAAARDAPQPIRDLLKARNGAPVFRYRPDSNFQTLRRYYADRPAQDPQITSAAKRGTAPGALPQYLLICGSPQQIPWELQYVLSGPCFVGRLDLDDSGLRRYVDALVAGWADAPPAANERVVWATDYGADDITWLMRRVVAQPILDKLIGDNQIGAGRARGIAGAGATVEALAAALTAQRPALIVTASHGMTGPLNDTVLMTQQLGYPVDATRALVTPAILESWDPCGCIWYAHACCSAGSDAQTRYDGLVAAGSALDGTLKQIAAGVGAKTAPFPRALLSAPHPARAFVGHVEPTFNWTLRSPQTGQVLTTSLVYAVYDCMHRIPPEPVGRAFDGWYREVGNLQSRAAAARKRFADVDAGVRDRARTDAITAELAATDRGSLVILGDPTACLPVLL